jgi:glycerol-3-phosphate dehydrogenase
LHVPTVCKDGSLNRARRERDLDALAQEPYVDVLVVGAGVTGAGVALDAASRGLSVLLIDKHDLAYGTSRFSSKLVHGGLRYLAHGEVGIAHECAVERGILLAHTAPHLARRLAMMIPLLPQVSRKQAALARAGFVAGDVLRTAARTPSALLPRSRRITATEVLDRAPAVRPDGLRGGLLYWDGQLEDDARLVVALARTAAAHGARVVTRCTAVTLTGDGAGLRDELTGTALDVRAGAVINAAGVWAGELVDGITLRPSRGSHIVLRRQVLGELTAAITMPVPGESSRFVFALPQRDGRVYVGLTDEPVDGPIPDVAEASEDEVTFLLGVLNSALHVSVRRDQVAGAYAGFRPLLDGGTGSTADLSRRHAVRTSPDGVTTIVGGKLTTYRRMAEDALDAAIEARGLQGGPCVTRRLPLVGAAGRDILARVPAPARLVARYGTEATAVIAEAPPELRAPIGGGLDITPAELWFAVRHEGALDADDLLHRRTRIGLIPADLELARPAADEALRHAG